MAFVLRFTTCFFTIIFVLIFMTALAMRFPFSFVVYKTICDIIPVCFSVGGQWSTSAGWIRVARVLGAGQKPIETTFCLLFYNHFCRLFVYGNGESSGPAVSRVFCPYYRSLNSPNVFLFYSNFMMILHPLRLLIRWNEVARSVRIWHWECGWHSYYCAPLFT